MSGPSSLEDTIQAFLESLQEGVKKSDKEIAALLLEFSELLFESPEDDAPVEISITQLGSFELDEFLNFYLQDMHPDDPAIVKKGKEFLKKFRKFLDRTSSLTKEQQTDWKEFFQENGI